MEHGIAEIGRHEEIVAVELWLGCHHRLGLVERRVVEHAGGRRVLIDGKVKAMEVNRKHVVGAALKR